jgi:hypothetical protein
MDIRDFSPGGPVENDPRREAAKGVVREVIVRAAEHGLHPGIVAQDVFTSCACMLLINGDATVELLHSAVEMIADRIQSMTTPRGAIN